MKIFFDLFPVILFFATFKLAGQHPEAAAQGMAGLLGDVAPAQAPILLATLVVILATVAQIVWVRLRHGRVDKMLWVSLVLVSGFGSLTLMLHDEAFIKWKPTVLYWFMAGSMLLATLFKKNAIRLMLQAQIHLPESAWLRLNLAWIAFFTGMGALNLYVAFHFSTETWVDFKLFGGMGLLLFFVLAQSAYLARHIQEEKP